MLLKKELQRILLELPSLKNSDLTTYLFILKKLLSHWLFPTKGICLIRDNLRSAINTEQRWNQYLGVLQQYRNDVQVCRTRIKKGDSEILTGTMSFSDSL